MLIMVIERNSELRAKWFERIVSAPLAILCLYYKWHVRVYCFCGITSS